MSGRPSGPRVGLAALALALLLAAAPSPAAGAAAAGAAAAGEPGSLLVFVCRAGDQWELFAWDPAGAEPPRRLTDTPHDELNPTLSPDRHRVAYADSAGHLWLQEIDGGERRRLDGEDETNLLLQPAFHPDGGAVLMPRRAHRGGDDTDLVLRLTDDGGDLAHGPAWESGAGPLPTLRLPMLSAQFSPAWAADGLRFAFTNLHARWTGSLVTEIWEARLDHSHARQLTLLDGFCDQPAWSPDGETVAFSCDGAEGYDLYRVSTTDRGVERLTRHPASDTDPVYAPDGNRILFVSTRSGIPALHLLDPDGGAVTELAPFGDEPRACQAPDWR